MSVEQRFGEVDPDSEGSIADRVGSMGLNPGRVGGLASGALIERVGKVNPESDYDVLPEWVDPNAAGAVGSPAISTSFGPDFEVPESTGRLYELEDGSLGPDQSR